MAGGDFSGYFLQGLSSGLQSGLNMGQQIQEMRWQKKQRKELEEKQAKMLEVSNIWNAKIKEAGADNIYSDEEIAQISTIYLSGGYEFTEHYKGAMDAIKSMNKAKYDQEKEWMDLFTSGVEGLPSGDIQAMYDYVLPYITSEKGKNILEAHNNILQKRAKIAQTPQTVSPYDFYGQSPADVQGQIAGSVAGQTPGLEGVEFSQPATAQPTEMDKMGETQKKLDYAYNTGNANYFNQVAKSLGSPATFDTYKQGYEKPVVPGVDGVDEPTPETVNTLQDWEASFDIKDEKGPKTEEEYNRQLNLLAQSKDNYRPKYANWKEALIAEAKGIGKELEGITDKGDYNLLLNVYMQKLEEIKAKYPEVNLDQFKEFKENKNWFDKLKERVGL